MGPLVIGGPVAEGRLRPTRRWPPYTTADDVAGSPLRVPQGKSSDFAQGKLAHAQRTAPPTAGGHAETYPPYSPSLCAFCVFAVNCRCPTRRRRSPTALEAHSAMAALHNGRRRGRSQAPAQRERRTALLRRASAWRSQAGTARVQARRLRSQDGGRGNARPTLLCPRLRRASALRNLRDLRLARPLRPTEQLSTSLSCPAPPSHPHPVLWNSWQGMQPLFAAA